MPINMSEAISMTEVAQLWLWPFYIFAAFMELHFNVVAKVVKTLVVQFDDTS